MERLIPFGRLGDNVAAGRVTAAVVATSSQTGRTVVFVATRGDVPGDDRARGIEYVKTSNLTGEHVRASAAIPAAFPAVYVRDENAPGWYVDGGTRMNTATKPAISLGAGRIIIVGPVGTEPDHRDADEPDRRPDAFEGIAHLVQGPARRPARRRRSYACLDERVAPRRHSDPSVTRRPSPTSRSRRGAATRS